jgi:phosphoribosylanthranilate isomerase
VRVDIKFCGLTRAEDAEQAVALGAAYVGVILAGGPRQVTPARAAEILADVPASVRRVGVFGDHTADVIACVADGARLDVVQIHGSHDARRVSDLRRLFRGQIWRVLRLGPTPLPADTHADTDIAGLAEDVGDGLLLDSYVEGALGGTGVALPWESLAPRVSELRAVHAGRPIVLAGGLTSGNVQRAIQALSPDVVDVSSGVESAPGIKDHSRMRVFRDAVSIAATSA